MLKARLLSEGLLPLLLHFLELSCFDVIDETMKLDRCIFGGEVWRLGKKLHVIFDGLLGAKVKCQWIEYRVSNQGTRCGIGQSCSLLNLSEFKRVNFMMIKKFFLQDASNIVIRSVCHSAI